ncbi:MAG: gamma-glutamyl-gamma-aminobutyrate hydrolase family protein [Proteobacteria bacterium]|nr:gamma-glutamyl-gamma-aminobutyrate hydrolase family protein [Pseudomonadota bacterium]
MKILVTMRQADAKAYVEPRQAISDDWVVLFQRLKYTPILVPTGFSNYEAFFDFNPEALLLTGGDSVGAHSKDASAEFTKRDLCELGLIEKAIKRKLPIIGICRGMQILNIFFGGVLTRNIPFHVKNHAIVFEQNKYHYVAGEHVNVNSFHQDGIYEGQLANEFKIIAKSRDGGIEFVEHRDLPISAIHWHPERENKEALMLDELIFKERFGFGK